MPRIGVAGFLHESNSFLARPTPYEDFASTSLTHGQEMLERWRHSNHELGGMLSGCVENGLEPVALLATYAVPSGPVTSDAFERIVAAMLTGIHEAGALDGLLLALHGATVSEQFPDADGEVLRRVRQRVGADLPVMVTFDLHANLSRQMARHSHALIGYRSNPHLDQRQRGVEAAALLGRMVRGEIGPVQHLETPPLLLRNSRQYTSELPARALYEDLGEVLTWPGILSASVAMGFLHSDVEEAGASFLAVADRDAPLAERAARWMARRAWDRRAEFVGDLPSPQQAIAEAGAAARLPVVLMDTGDNAGGGSAADSAVLLEEMLRQNVPNGLIVLYDPAAVRACVEAGVRAEVALAVGGHTDALHGQPVAIRGRVRTISDGLYEETAVRHGGWSHYDQGVTAVVETPEQHTVVLTSRRMAPLSLEQILSLGIKPERKRVIVAKGVVAPRAAYGPIAAQVILVDTPGATADDPRKLPYRRRRRPLYPLEPDTTF